MDFKPMIYTIYTLINPINNSIFYIGCTTNVKERYWFHCKLHNNSSTEKNKITKEIRSNGLKPIMKEICFFKEKKEAYQFEKELSKDLIKHGIKLAGELHGTERSENLKCIARSMMQKRNQSKKKPIKDGNNIFYASISEASKILGIHSLGIHNVLVGKQKTFKGMVFSYA